MLIVILTEFFRSIILNKVIGTDQELTIDKILGNTQPIRMLLLINLSTLS